MCFGSFCLLESTILINLSADARFDICYTLFNNSMIVLVSIITISSSNSSSRLNKDKSRISRGCDIIITKILFFTRSTYFFG